MNAIRRFLGNRYSALKFALVGGIGFCVDSSLMVVLYQWIELDLAYARVGAFLCAATLNWYLNRQFTFRERLQPRGKSSEWARFVTSAVVSAVPNLGLFFLLVQLLPAGFAYVMLAMCCGILAGYYSNYQLARGWVYRTETP